MILIWAMALLTACSKENKATDVEPDKPETPNLTHLPFGGIGPTNILIRNQGDPHPDFLSLWLCGLPADGAGADNASDWTNPDGTWDYTQKPQVEGNVNWK